MPRVEHSRVEMDPWFAVVVDHTSRVKEFDLVCLPDQSNLDVLVCEFYGGFIHKVEVQPELLILLDVGHAFRVPDKVNVHGDELDRFLGESIPSLLRFRIISHMTPPILCYRFCLAAHLLRGTVVARTAAAQGY